MKNCTFLKSVNKQKYFSNLDICFAENFSKDLSCEDEKTFLAYLFLISRNGYISLYIDDDKKIYPDPKFFNFDNELLDDAFFKVLKNKIFLGSKSISLSLVNHFTDKHFFKPIVKLDNWFYLQKNYVFETEIVKNIQRLIQNKKSEKQEKELFLKILSEEDCLTIEQKNAIEKTFENNLSFILGGPGTGKTYTAAYLIKILSKYYINAKGKTIKIALTAPTGKATSQLQEYINTPNFENECISKTLHSLLKMREGKTKKFNSFKLDYDFIIVDEASMIDIKLMAYFLNSIKDETKVVFIGDPNQLTPVEGGNVFSELIKSKEIAITFLKMAKRFENEKILKLAEIINSEDVLSFKNELENSVEFYDIDDLCKAKEFLFEQIKKYGFSPAFEKPNMDDILNRINDFRILSSIKQGPFGVDNLNLTFLKEIQKNTEFGKYMIFPIIICENDYSLDLYNGMIGALVYPKKSKDFFEGALAYFKIENEIKSFPLFHLPKYEYAFAISVHKSQGSEFKNVCVVINYKTQNLSKELLYTAITRAKQNISIISKKEVLCDILKNNFFKISPLITRLF
ncbi:MAG: exodeoxyribonuclease V subunit alpha [Parachlamydiales bacterium]|nr:exodeoxyribonuclease V subunit alpha [Parachlamydiales bacterium]